MINQRPGVLLDSLVGAPEHVRSVQGSVVNWYLRRLEEVSAGNMCIAVHVLCSAVACTLQFRCCMHSAIHVSFHICCNEL